MKYYKVPEHFDGKQIYTQKKDYFTLVNIKKNNIYFLFGARFEITNN